MTEEEYYQLNRDKIDINDISTWKYFPIGKAMRKTYDYHNLSLIEYLERYYKEYHNKLQWKNWMQNIIFPLFENEISRWKRYNIDNKNDEYKLWFEDKHNIMKFFFTRIEPLQLFDKDVLLFFSYLKAMNFFNDSNLSVNEWINSKNFNLGGRHKVAPDKYSLKEIAQEKFGNNLVRDKLMSLEWHKK